ncbi:MAG: hypothetical protein A2Y33_01975 [Spirochaetes bacterium GWF1_51_8]|nr:MAG: hypothetical protein A2Y33_01975 [Spirochaetes bacterium GWF1_51_8]
MRALINLILVGIIIFSLISYFSGSKFSDLMKGNVFSGGDNTGEVSAVSEWKSGIEKAGLLLKELGVLVEEYNSGAIESPSDIEAKVIEIDQLMIGLKQYKSSLSGDERKEFIKSFNELEDEWDDMQDNYKVVEDILEEMETDGDESAETNSGVKEHFFGE